MRRGTAAALALVLALSSAGPDVVRADVAFVPPSLQVELLDRVAYFQHGFRARAVRRPTVLIVRSRRSNLAERVAAQLVSAIRETRTIGGVAVVPVETSFESIEALQQTIERTNASIVWFAPGLEAEVPAISTALATSETLTIASSASSVRDGAILGFGLESSRPVIFINERQASRQGIRFSFEVLSRARVIR